LYFTKRGDRDADKSINAARGLRAIVDTTSAPRTPVQRKTENEGEDDVKEEILRKIN